MKYMTHNRIKDCMINVYGIKYYSVLHIHKGQQHFKIKNDSDRKLWSSTACTISNSLWMATNAITCNNPQNVHHGIMIFKIWLQFSKVVLINVQQFLFQNV